MKELKIFETHSHYDDEAFDGDRTELLNQIHRDGIKYIINIAADKKSCYTTLELTKKYDYIYGAIGIHPESLENLSFDFMEEIENLANNPKIVAIGEIGLDYHWESFDRKLQKEWFREQLRLAKKIGKPVVIHSRDACQDTLEILKGSEAKDVPGVMHCYSYSPETAKELYSLGWYFGIGGVVTFKNAKKLVDTVREIPLDHLLLETDCPYLSPVPYRGSRNDSSNLKLVAEKIAAIKEISYGKVVEETYNNAKKLFGI